MLSAVFYLFKIGSTAEIKDGKIVQKFNWKYPLAISLLLWLIWHFILYPPYGLQKKSGFEDSTKNKDLGTQKIDITNWT